LRLAKGSKIRIIGLIIGIIGLSLQGVLVLVENWGSGYNFVFSLITFVGAMILIYGIQVRQSEKRKEQPKT
jgi:preprotein translocase subunit YajC